MNYNEFSELYHHGIKGQRWGIRRFENEDGSLTAEGKKRYSDSDGSSKSSNDNSKPAATVGKTIKGGIKGGLIATAGVAATNVALGVIGSKVIGSQKTTLGGLQTALKFEKVLSAVGAISPMIITSGAVVGAVKENNKQSKKQ